MNNADRQTEQLAFEMVSRLRGNWTTQMLYVAAKLRIADHLHGQPLTIEALSKACGAEPASLLRLMRALANIGVFEELASHQFASNPTGDLLRTDHPMSLYHAALLQGSERYKAWGNLLECVKTGDSAFAEIFGKGVFEWHQDHPDRASVFHAAMSEYARLETEALLQAYPFEQHRHIVDIGGGDGTALIRILQTHAHLHGTVLDLQEVVDLIHIPKVLHGRLERLDGNFLDAIPMGADLYLLKNVLHDWDDRTCVTILKNVHKAMSGTSRRLLIYEQALPKGPEPSIAKLLDLNMLVMHQGAKERTIEQYEALLSEARLNLDGVLQTSCPLTILQITS